jgi:hypothetical protein
MASHELGRGIKAAAAHLASVLQTSVAKMPGSLGLGNGHTRRCVIDKRITRDISAK